MAKITKEIGKYLIKNEDGYFVLKTEDGIFDIFDSTFEVLKADSVEVKVFGKVVNNYQEMHQAAMGGVGANAIKNIK